MSEQENYHLALENFKHELRISASGQSERSEIKARLDSGKRIVFVVAKLYDIRVGTKIHDDLLDEMGVAADDNYIKGSIYVGLGEYVYVVKESEYWNAELMYNTDRPEDYVKEIIDRVKKFIEK